MRKGSFFKKALGAVLTAVTVFAAVSSHSLVTNNEGAVAQAAGRVVSINSCTISGDQVVVNVSAGTLPSSDDGKYYLYADEVYQDGTVGTVVATTERAGNATFTFPLNFYSAESNLSKKFLVAVKSGGSMVQVNDEQYITNP